MKWITKITALAALSVTQLNVLHAGSDLDVVEPTVEMEEIGSAVSGWASLDYNSHFMSYGADVWAEGRGFGDVLFNPSIGLDIDLGGGFSLSMGTWWDVNENATGGSIGDEIQEIDLWLGLNYTYDKWSASLTYQEWLYASDSERILDLILAYDTFLSPSLTIHGRVDGNGTQEEGVVFVPAIGYGFDLGPVSFSIPLALGFVTEDYYQDGEGGFGYVTTGLSASYPLSMIPAKFGEFDIHGGVSYYYTDPDVIANKDDHYITLNAGVGWAF